MEVAPEAWGQEMFPRAWSVRHVKYSQPNDWVGT